jgi:hypothetical protein
MDSWWVANPGDTMTTRTRVDRLVTTCSDTSWPSALSNRWPARSGFRVLATSAPHPAPGESGPVIDDGNQLRDLFHPAWAKRRWSSQGTSPW